MRIDAAKLRWDISSAIRRAIHSLRTGNIIAESLLVDARLHVQARYPGSTHWDPSNISISETTEDSGSIDIDIPGATRAYHDIEILPRWRQHLTIPLHPMAKGKKAEDIDGLFRPRNKNILAKVIDGQLVPIFALVKRAFQH